MHVYTMSAEERAEDMNLAKDRVLYALVAEGIITEAVAQEYALTHAFVIHPPSWFSRVYKRILGKKDASELRTVLVRFQRLDSDNAQAPSKEDA